MSAVAGTQRTAKFERRRAEILNVATDQINIHGARGMTLTAVARELGLDTSSVTYYFKRKDALSAACFERTLSWMRERAEVAAALPDARVRVREFLHAHLVLHAHQRDPKASRLALLSDLRTLDEETRAPLDAAYTEIFRIVRGFFEFGEEPGARTRSLIAASVLMATVFWLPGWIERYLVRDFPRVEARLFDVLENGLGVGRDWPTNITPLDDDGPQDAQTRFLHAATALINREGYLGASVEKIAAELGVSTGSFYHHLENKDDLVVACFERNFAIVERAQALADRAGANEGERLAVMATSLVALQFAGDSPMLKISAYQALPLELRTRMLQATGQVTRHVAGTIADGIADGSIRAVDPMLASQTVMVTINIAQDLRRWAATRSLESAVETFVRTLSHGIF